MNPYLEKIYNQITIDLSSHLFKMLQDYPGHELEIVRLMTAQLGSLIAVASKDPQTALVYYANRLAQFHWQEVRSDYFANTLGVNTTRPTNKPFSEVRDIGSARRRLDDGPASADTDGGGRAIQTGGDPAQKKPEDVV